MEKRPIPLRITDLPPIGTTICAVESYLRGTGSLLWFWDSTEARCLVSSVYDPAQILNQANIAEVLAIAAVGSYCDSGSDSNLLRQDFLLRLLRILDNPEDMSPIQRLRLLSCEAICCFNINLDQARILLREFWPKIWWR